ncbi:dual specificity phosphatase, catalytic domain containing protein [Acanthamoeba castellanii str. Neff]|uniref:protein-tyrosine-phosphatase n=1 Tax=Acanthamoeba castellanii (strain ATCC 30010 / Neff) TaxID=1257118 RepID=L8HDS7_ACACF|nr:dual specificity phosphatase, catalytic domain containing protein [Acanthamoeba castellanii str. Neff]ELR23345.1 dual specificity phosphatase, catalytic domain containing protein [Acanthamoeba castellanii str. Neff]
MKKILIDPEREVRYHCATCGDFDACEECLLGEEVSHPHPLAKIKPKLRAKLLYSLKDPKTGNTLFLSNFPVAIPGSTHLTQHNIRAVLSVIEFDKVDGTYELAQKAFLQGKHMHKSAATSGVVYHHLNIPDLQNPALLADYGAFNVLEESTTFIDKAIDNGNVIVHCKEGQRRSPTMFLAWMITRGFDVDKAIKMIGKDYNDPHFEWKDKYVKTRASWIVELRKWEKDWKAKQERWLQTKGKVLAEDWDRLFLGEASIATRVRRRKRAPEDEEDVDITPDIVMPKPQQQPNIAGGKRKREEAPPAAGGQASARNRLNDMLQRFEDLEEQKEVQKRAEKRMRTNMAKEAAKVEAATNGFLMTAVSSQATRRRAFEENRRMAENIGFRSTAHTRSHNPGHM